MDTNTIDQETPVPPRRPHLLKWLTGLLVAGLLAAASWYFGSYACKVGNPTGATITVRGENQTAAAVTLDGTQLDELCRLLKKTRPTLFLEEHEGINNENAIITLSYADGSEKTFSLFYYYWLADDILYEGVAEDLTMSSMMGDFVHAGGRPSPELKEFLLQFLTPASAGK